MLTRSSVSVRWRLCDDLGGETAAGAYPVLDDEGLVELFRQPLSHEARKQWPAAGSKADDAHGPRRIR